MRGCRPLSADEIDAVSAAIDGPTAARDRCLFVLGCRTGFRVSELLSLSMGDVWQNGRVVDSVAVRRSNMKGKKSGRTVPLSASAKAALTPWLEQLLAEPLVGDATALFRSRKGSNQAISRQQAHRVLKAAYAAAGLSGALATHTMRKSFANRVYSNLCERRAEGAPIDPFRLTSKALGHASIASTDKYLSFAETDVTAAILGE